MHARNPVSLRNRVSHYLTSDENRYIKLLPWLGLVARHTGEQARTNQQLRQEIIEPQPDAPDEKARYGKVLAIIWDDFAVGWSRSIINCQ